MSKDNLVSVIMPAYNPGRFITQAVDSVLVQKYRNWELIIVNDGSRDFSSWQLPEDDRIRVFHQQNQGLSAARNVGVMHSKGDLIAFLDADDVWFPGKLDSQVKALGSNPNAVLAHTQMQIIDESGRIIGSGWGGGYKSYDDLLDGCGVCVSSVVIRREILFKCGLFDPYLVTAQDFDLWLKATRFGDMYADSRTWLSYRWHVNNLSQNFRKTFMELRRILLRQAILADEAKDEKTLRLVRRGLKRTANNFSRQALGTLLSRSPDRNKSKGLRDYAYVLSRYPLITTGSTCRIFGEKASRLFCR